MSVVPKAVVVVGAFALAACGSDAAPASPSQISTDGSRLSDASSAVSAPSASSPEAETPDPRLGLAAVTADVEARTEAERVDGGCGFVDEAWLVTLATETFSGRPVRLGERGMTDDAIGRVIEVEVVEVYADGAGQLEPGATASIFVADTELEEGGYRVEVPALDVDAVMSRDLVTVFGNHDGTFIRPRRMVSMVDGVVSFNGYCQHEAETLAVIADQLGDADPLAMLARFAAANARGEGVADLTEAYAQWRADMDAATMPPDWQDQDPTVRSLDPQAVPAELRESLDVVGVSFAVDDLGGAAAIGVRTESGVTYPLIGAGSSFPMMSPLYFLRGVDAMVEVFVQPDPGSAEAQVVASVGLAEISDAGGGIEVAGSVADGTITVATLQRAELAERLGVDLAQLDELRATYLAN